MEKKWKMENETLLNSLQSGSEFKSMKQNGKNTSSLGKAQLEEKLTEAEYNLSIISSHLPFSKSELESRLARLSGLLKEVVEELLQLSENALSQMEWTKLQLTDFIKEIPPSIISGLNPNNRQNSPNSPSIVSNFTSPNDERQTPNGPNSISLPVDSKLNQDGLMESKSTSQSKKKAPKGPKFLLPLDFTIPVLFPPDDNVLKLFPLPQKPFHLEVPHKTFCNLYPN